MHVSFVSLGTKVDDGRPILPASGPGAFGKIPTFAAPGKPLKNHEHSFIPVSP